MKISITTSVLILALGAAICWRDQQQLSALRQTQMQLSAEAARLGISVDLSHPADPSRITKRVRKNNEVETRQATVEFIALAREMEALQARGGGALPEAAAMQKRIMDFMDRMMLLDSAQLKTLIAGLRACPDLKDETRQHFIGLANRTLATTHPQTALALLTGPSDLYQDNGNGKHLITSALANLARNDPAAALKWIRDNREKSPDLVTDEAKRGFIKGVAIHDPGFAIKLIGELGVEDSSQAIANIFSAARTPAQRSASLLAFRDYLPTLTDEVALQKANERAVSGLAASLLPEGFTAATQWIEEAEMTPAELNAISRHVSGYFKSSETGQWISWIGDKLPSDQSKQLISTLVSQWTINDYQAVGKWLADTPSGTVKNTAISGYAEILAQYEPKAAAEWAVTLPPGQERENTLLTIYINWSRKDPTDKVAVAAAAAFAAEHGIKYPK